MRARKSLVPTVPFDEECFLRYVRQRIRERRKSLGLSKRALGARIGYSESWIARLERQNGRLHLGCLGHVAVALQTPVEAFLPPELPSVFQSIVCGLITLSPSALQAVLAVVNELQPPTPPLLAPPPFSSPCLQPEGAANGRMG